MNATPKDLSLSSFSWFDRRSCTTSALGACLYGSMAEDTGPETAAAFSCAPRDGEADR